LYTKVVGFGKALKEEIREVNVALRNITVTYGTFNGRFVKAVFQKGVPMVTPLHSPIDKWTWQLVSLEVVIPRGEEEGVLEELRPIYDYLQAHYNLEYLYSLVMDKEFICKCNSCGKEWWEKFKATYSNMIVCPYCKHVIYTNGLNGFLKYCKPAY
jgi:DNA-directed RNA polymerase subunit RPC12/RpoP